MPSPPNQPEPSVQPGQPGQPTRPPHHHDNEDLSAARLWLTLVRQPSVADRLEAIYALIADQVSARAPVCQASGRCCRFERYGHRLYVTGLEAAWCVVRLAPPAPALSRLAVAHAVQQGGCPFQDGRRCTVHTIKPIGCRTFYCDPSAQAWQEQLTERAHGMVRALHTALRCPYRYMEWRAMLDLLACAQEHDPGEARTCPPHNPRA